MMFTPEMSCMVHLQRFYICSSHNIFPLRQEEGAAARMRERKRQIQNE